YNDAFILEGSPLAIGYALTTALIGALLLARAAQTFQIRKGRELAIGAVMFAAAVAVGGSTVWLGTESAATLGAAAIGIALLVGMRALGSAPQARLAKA